jgi:hypothetical protein
LRQALLSTHLLGEGYGKSESVHPVYKSSFRNQNLSVMKQTTFPVTATPGQSPPCVMPPKTVTKLPAFNETRTFVTLFRTVQSGHDPMSVASGPHSHTPFKVRMNITIPSRPLSSQVRDCKDNVIIMKVNITYICTVPSPETTIHKCLDTLGLVT